MNCRPLISRGRIVKSCLLREISYTFFVDFSKEHQYPDDYQTTKVIQLKGIKTLNIFDSVNKPRSIYMSVENF